MPEVIEMKRDKPDVLALEFRRDHEPRKQADGTMAMVEVVFCRYAPRGVMGREMDMKWTSIQRHNPMVYEALLPAYEYWQKGEELPDGGTALSSWSGVTAGQIARLKEMHIRSVEDLSKMNDAAAQRFGTGAVGLKKASIEWLDSRDSSAKAHEMVALRESVEVLAGRLKELEAERDDLRARVGDDGEAKPARTIRKSAA